MKPYLQLLVPAVCLYGCVTSGHAMTAESSYRGWKTLAMRNVMSANVVENPYVFESEVLSPFAELKPGQSYTWRYDWYACNIGGDFPVANASDAGVVAEPLTVEWASRQARIKGRFGVFTPGTVRAEFANAQGGLLQTLDLTSGVSPLKPVVLDTAVAAPADAASVRLLLIGTDGKAVGELAKADFPEAQAAARWPADKANAWYDAVKWPFGANFVPSTAINPLEMWQADTFDPETIDRELGWAAAIGMNTMRVFLHDIPWKTDSEGFCKRIDRFLDMT